MITNPDQNDPNPAATGALSAAADPKGAGGSGGAEPKGASKPASPPAKKAASAPKETKPSPDMPARAKPKPPPAPVDTDYTAARAQTPDGYSTGLHPLTPADEQARAYDAGYASAGRVWPD